MNTSFSLDLLSKDSLLASKYRILGTLGQGASGRVYLAMQENIGVKRAIKCVPKNSLQSGYGELMALSDLDHPRLPHLVDLLEGEDCVYVVMELIEGQSLKRYIENIRPGDLPFSRLLAWGEDLSEILTYLHSRKPALIYRDLKPSNIMICPDGNLKLIDFGTLLCLADSSDREPSLGSPVYAAPEQFEGSCDERSDIYALGVCLRELAAFLPENQRRERDGLERVIAGCCRKKPGDRFQTAWQVRSQLLRLEEASEEGRRAAHLCLLLAPGILILLLLGTSVFLRKPWGRPDREAKGTEEIGTRLAELIREDREDLTFSLEEEGRLLGLLAGEEAEKLAEESPLTYAGICLQVGKLYWYYYGQDASGDQVGQGARMQAAGEWLRRSREALRRFKQGGQQKERGQAKEGRDREIAGEVEEHLALLDFHREAWARQREGREKGLYREHFLRLQEYEAKLDQGENDLIRIRGRQEVLESLYLERDSYLKDGVSREEYGALLAKLAEKIRSMKSENPYVIRRQNDSLKILEMAEEEARGEG